ncbi:MAG: hypothetical protein ACOC0D_03385 [Spirochaeta sp.]
MKLSVFLCCCFGLLSVHPAIPRSSLHTVIESEGVSTHFLVLQYGLVRARLNLAYDSAVRYEMPGLRVGSTGIRLIYGPITWLQPVLRPAPAPFSAVRSFSSRKVPVFDLDIARSITDVQWTAVAAAVDTDTFHTAAVAAKSSTARNHYRFQGVFRFKRAGIGAAYGLQLLDTPEPALDSQPYILDNPAPGRGISADRHGLLSIDTALGTSIGGLYQRQVPGMDQAVGAWVYHIVRWEDGWAECRFAHEPGGFLAHSSRYARPGRSIMLTVQQRSGGRGLQRVTAYYDFSEPGSCIQYSGRVPLGKTGWLLRTGWELTSGDPDGTHVSPGIQWQHRSLSHYMRFRFNSKLHSGHQRHSQQYSLLYGRGWFRIEYSADYDSFIPGIDQQLRVGLLRSDSSLQLQIDWNSLVRGVDGKLSLSAYTRY